MESLVIHRLIPYSMVNRLPCSGIAILVGDLHVCITQSYRFSCSLSLSLSLSHFDKDIDRPYSSAQYGYSNLDFIGREWQRIVYRFFRRRAFPGGPERDDVL